MTLPSQQQDWSRVIEMEQDNWSRWIMQTATTLEDLEGIIQDTGIERIDREHNRLVEYVLEMGEAIRYSDTSSFDSRKLETQNLLFSRFLNALQTHFKTEEYYIDRYRLKGKPYQQQEHDNILKNFKNIISDFKEGILSTFQVVRISLISELVNHINGIDHQTFLLENFLPILRSAHDWDDVSEIIKSTGLPFVDEEHKVLTIKIISLKIYLSKIENKIQTKSQKEKSLNLIKQLFKYTQTHFDHEESFLKKYRFDAQNHISLHKYFLSHVFKLGREIEANRNVDLEAFIDFLLSWWINHINGNDYKEFHFTRIAEPVFNLSKTSDDFTWLIRKVDNPTIDNEHAHLISLLLKLNEKVNAGKMFDVRKELSLIADFAEKHFIHEEKIMSTNTLDIDGIHADAHQKLLGYVEDAVSHAVSGRSQISPAFLKRMMRWWVEHTNGMDYDTFVLNRPLT